MTHFEPSLVQIWCTVWPGHVTKNTERTNTPKLRHFGCLHRPPTLPYQTQLWYAEWHHIRSLCVRFLTKLVKKFQSHEKSKI